MTIDTAALAAWWAGLSPLLQAALILGAGFAVQKLGGGRLDLSGLVARLVGQPAGPPPPPAPGDKPAPAPPPAQPADPDPVAAAEQQLLAAAMNLWRAVTLARTAPGPAPVSPPPPAPSPPAARPLDEAVRVIQAARDLPAAPAASAPPRP